MKKIILSMVMVMVVISANAQGLSRGRVDTRVISGVTEHVLDGPRFNFTLYLPGAEEQYTLQPSNNVVAFKSVGALTNVVVVLPNPTNTLRRAYKLIANGNVTIKLTNTVGATYNTSTNVTALSTWTSATNSAFWVHNNNGSNWWIAPF